MQCISSKLRRTPEVDDSKELSVFALVSALVAASATN